MKVTLILGLTIAATVGMGCGSSNEKPVEQPASKPISATNDLTKPVNSEATSEETPTLAADDEMAAGKAEVADGESPAEPETPDEPDEPAEPPAPKYDGAINSIALSREFEKDQKAAEAKYQNKEILVEGRVPFYPRADGYVYLEGSEVLRKVVCIIKPPPTLDEIKSGDTVVVKGKFDLVAVLGVALKGCELVKVNP